MKQRLRGVINAATATLVCAGLCVPAPAYAVTPPSIDAGRLPPPSRPAPSGPTRQRSPCTVAEPIKARRPGHDPLRALNLESAWRISRGEGQRVAIIDTGVNRHQRLHRLEAGGDYVSQGDGTQDCDGHGTVVAGIIGAATDPDEAGAFAGVAPEATLLTIRQSTMKFGTADDAADHGYGDVDTLAKAVRTAADLGATVINISSIACAPGTLEDSALGAAVAYAADVKDVVVVVAAGNTGGPGQCPEQSAESAASWSSATVAVSPAWYDDYVLTVGSVDGDGVPSSFSLAGPWVDVAAPGENMVSLNPGGVGLVDALPVLDLAVPISGTSYAAPVVSGLAALVRSRFPDWTARQVTQRIESTARQHGHWNPVVGNGLVDPIAALRSEPESNPAPSGPEPQSAEPDTGRARATALIGAGGCAAVLAVAIAFQSLGTRLRRPAAGDGVADAVGRDSISDRSGLQQR